MKKSLSLLFLITALNGSLFAQKTVEYKNVCELEKAEYDFSPEPVTSFKESLTIELTINEAFDTYKTYKKKLVFKETFDNESSIIQIAPTIALQVSIARVEAGGKKYYLSTMIYYLKKGKCWEPMSNSNTWSKMSLGTKTTGNSFNGVGFEGMLYIH